MTPLWATILIALAAGLIGTLATISHQRSTEFRTRMIEAADELLATASKAALVGRDISNDVYRIHHEEGGVGVVFNEPPGFEQFAQHVDVLTINVMRVSLLFGMTRASVAASEFIDVLQSMGENIHAETRGEGDAFSVWFSAYISASQEFIQEARREIHRVGVPWPLRMFVGRSPVTTPSATA